MRAETRVFAFQIFVTGIESAHQQILAGAAEKLLRFRTWVFGQERERVCPSALPEGLAVCERYSCCAKTVSKFGCTLRMHLRTE